MEAVEVLTVVEVLYQHQDVLVVVLVMVEQLLTSEVQEV